LQGELKGFYLARRLWTVSSVSRLGLIALLIGTWLTTTAFSTRQSSTATLIGLVMFTLGWAFALTAAVNSAPIVYLIVSAYLGWYGILIGGALAGSLGFALPTLWMLILGWQVMRRPIRRIDRVCSFLLCFGAAYLTYGAFGLSHLWVPIPLASGVLILALIYFGALFNPIVRRWAIPSRLDAIKNPRSIFWLTLLIVGSFFALSYTRDAAQSAANANLAMQNLLGAADLFWMWLGGGLFAGSLGLGRWLTREAMQIVTARWLRWFIPIGWLAVAIFGYLATGPLPLSIAVFAYHLGLTDWVSTWSNPDYFAVQAQVCVSLIALAYLIILRLRHTYTDNKLAWANGLWIAAYLSVLGYHSSLMGFAGIDQRSIQSLLAWAALALVGGILWRMAKHGADWSGESSSRLYSLLAMLLIMLSVISIVLSANAVQFIQESTLYSFYGIVYLGIPLALYTLLTNQSHFVPMRGIKLAALFALGSLSAIVVLGINPLAGIHLLIAPLIWAIVLSSHRLQREDRLNQLVAGGALALGFAVFWLKPLVLPIPFLQIVQDWQAQYSTAALNRSGMQLGQLWFTAAALIVGVAIGWIMIQRRSQLRWLLIAFCAVAFGLIVPRLPEISKSDATLIANQPGSIPSIVSTPVPNWIETNLVSTTLKISIPPDWSPNPNGAQGELLNLISPQGDLIFSVALFDGATDVQKLAQAANEIRRGSFADYQIDVGPEQRSSNGKNILWLEWSSAANSTRGVDAYTIIPQGILQFSLWSAPNAFEQRRAEFEQIINSLQ
ncbi:MAG TPA: hypothetical protein VFF70_01505, partial [Anaerolineae bacterium]|nr:hypothetical protein [Anaerolineae bacterium]